MAIKPYGYELIIDLHGCNAEKFNREDIEGYMIAICHAIGMEREDLHFWDYVGIDTKGEKIEPHLAGTSAVQFITTSNIVIHTLDLLKAAYINIFSCKSYNKDIAEQVTKGWFGASKCSARFIERI